MAETNENIQDLVEQITCKKRVQVYEKTVKCSICGWRLLDRITATTGIIELKCPRCGKIIKIDLSAR